MEIMQIEAITNHLSVSEHVHDIIGKCAQMMHALKILRRHGMSQEVLRIVYKAVALAKLTYAAPAWWGFASADDTKRLEDDEAHVIHYLLPPATSIT